MSQSSGLWKTNSSCVHACVFLTLPVSRGVLKIYKYGRERVSFPTEGWEEKDYSFFPSERESGLCYCERTLML